MQNSAILADDYHTTCALGVIARSNGMSIDLRETAGLTLLQQQVKRAVEPLALPGAYRIIVAMSRDRSLPEIVQKAAADILEPVVTTITRTGYHVIILPIVDDRGLPAHLRQAADVKLIETYAKYGWDTYLTEMSRNHGQFYNADRSEWLREAAGILAVRTIVKNPEGRNRVLRSEIGIERRLVEMAGYPDLPTRVKYAACAELKKIAVRHTVKSGMKNPLEGDGTLSPGTVKIPAALVAWRQSGVQRRVYA